MRKRDLTYSQRKNKNRAWRDVGEEELREEESHKREGVRRRDRFYRAGDQTAVPGFILSIAQV